MRNRHCDHHSLALPARKLVGVLAQPLLRPVDADIGKCLGKALPVVRADGFDKLCADAKLRGKHRQWLLVDTDRAFPAQGPQPRLRKADTLLSHKDKKSVVWGKSVSV